MTTRELTKLARRVWPKAPDADIVVSVSRAGVIGLRVWYARVYLLGVGNRGVYVYHESRKVAVAGLAAALRAMAEERL